MNREELYRMAGPTAWAEAPAAFSFSSLKNMGACLRKWQLMRSRYGDLKSYPEKPSEPAEVGIIVHHLLSLLFRGAALAGYPPLGSEAFLQVARQVDIVGTARRKLADFAERARHNPRALGFHLEASAREVYNHVGQAFREEYAKVVQEAPRFTPIPKAHEAALQGGGAPADRLRLLELSLVLSEEEVRHPSLPLLGFIDLLVRRDGKTAVLDFKTGAPRPEHKEQLLLYALIWWRSTGDMPAHIELRYGARAEGWPVTEEDLLDVEKRVAAQIQEHTKGLLARPAAASVGAHCQTCSVRHLCSDYWSTRQDAPPAKQGPWVDGEIVVSAKSSKTSFSGLDERGKEVSVVFDEEVGASWGPFLAGERLRLLGALREAEGNVLQITRATEVGRPAGGARLLGSR